MPIAIDAIEVESLRIEYATNPIKQLGAAFVLGIPYGFKQFGMAHAAYPGGTPFMPVCGDDAQAHQRVMALATLIGFDAIDLGPLPAARYLEPFAMTWIHLAIKQGYGRSFAFGVLRRGGSRSIGAAGGRDRSLG